MRHVSWWVTRKWDTCATRKLGRYWLLLSLGGWCDTFMCVSSSICDWFMCDVVMCDMTHLFVWLVYVWLSYVRHDSFVCDGTCRLFLSRGVWHNPSMSDSWFMCVIYSCEWFIHVCGAFMCVVYSCVWFIHMWLKKSGIMGFYSLEVSDMTQWCATHGIWEVGGWGRDPKKCTGRDWGITI